MAAKFERVEFLALEVVDPPATPVRDFIDPEYIRELAESIRENGLYEPIQVRPVDNRYEVVFGHRRYLACRLIGADKIKSIVKPMSDDEVITARLVENIQRADLGPIEIAKVYKVFKEKMGLSIPQMAKRVGKALSTVQMYLQLLGLEEEYQREVNKKSLSIGAALELDKIDDPVARRYYFHAAIENGVTVEVAKVWVSDYAKTKAGTFFAGGEGVPTPGIGSPSPPVYHTCGGCRGPVETSKVRMVPMCPECIKQLERG